MLTTGVGVFDTRAGHKHKVGGRSLSLTEDFLFLNNKSVMNPRTSTPALDGSSSYIQSFRLKYREADVGDVL